MTVDMMDRNYKDFKLIIKGLLKEDDILNILKNPLSRHFTFGKQMEIRNNPTSFFDEFEKIKDGQKYNDFITVSKDISEWIPLFLLDCEEDIVQHRTAFIVNFELMHVQSKELIEHFPMSEVFIRQCFREGILTQQTSDRLIAVYNTKGATTAKYRFLWDTNLRSKDFYGKLLVLFHRNKTSYISKCCDDLQKMIDDTAEPHVEGVIMAWANSVVEMNVNLQNRTVDGIADDNEESDGAPGE